MYTTIENDLGLVTIVMSGMSTEWFSSVLFISLGGGEFELFNIATKLIKWNQHSCEL